MKFKILLLVLTLTAFRSQSQFNDETKRVIVSGTRISLIPPAGFVLAQNFTGFKKDESMINVMDLAGGNYFSNTETFTREAFESQDVSVIDFEEKKVNGYSAKFIHILGSNDTESYNLVFGDSTFSVMLLAVFPDDDRTLGEKLKSSIFTVKYDKSIVIDPFETAPFTIDDSSNPFKFFKASSNMFIYSLGGKMETMNDGTLILIIPLPADMTVTPESTCDKMADGLVAQGFEDLNTASSMNIEINGYSAHETLVTGQMKGNQSYILTRVILQGSRQVVIQGVMNGSIKYINDIRALSETLRFK
ncbi:MAG: hypothetical protein JXR07_12775 [Reichenbachiella sp.]